MSDLPPGISTPSSLAHALLPVIQEACENRLTNVTWFRTDWQRGGAATGKATYAASDGESVTVVLKLPIVQRELTWNRRLQCREQSQEKRWCIPKLYASGTELGGYDLAWILSEHLSYGPLAHHWHESHIPRIARAAAEFYAATSTHPVDQPGKNENWQHLLDEALHHLKVNDPPERQQWTTLIKTLKGRLDHWLEIWNKRECTHWLHGDLHLANAMTREPDEFSPVCLLDLAEIHAGHWVEDAVYLERQLWGRPDRLQKYKPVKEIAQARKELGLSVDGDYPRLAMIRRGLLAATAPRFIKSEGHPAYLHACLQWLTIALNEVK
ncbi:MAG TPA: phosphotransferase [Phycisphaerales bacterium]|nr:phosphotransferase [Phycisphaerales bacterium]